MSLNQNESTNSRRNAAIEESTATPAMQQYLSLKKEYADCILFYRMGDFYELFFDDAVKASAILDIALTKRGKHAGSDIPMCGVPVHAAETYLNRLIASGTRVAICEQLETPEEAKKRGYKAVVQRGVVRVVTAGTITEETLLAGSTNNYLAALILKSGHGALAWLDISTGEFSLAEVTETTASALVARVAPRELIVSESVYGIVSAQDWFLPWRERATVRPDALFDSRKGIAALKDQFSVMFHDAFGELSPHDLSVCGALLGYVRQTQLSAEVRLDPPKRERSGERMMIDATTRRSLELTQSVQGERKGSLFDAIDSTVSAAGGRLLTSMLASPLMQREAIIDRLDAVTYFYTQALLREALRGILRSTSDMERALNRLLMGRGGPRDMVLVRDTLATIPTLQELFSAAGKTKEAPALIESSLHALTGFSDIARVLGEALAKEVPMLARDGGFVADGYRADLDEWRNLSRESKRVMMLLEQRLKQETDIPSLKIKFNNMLGYFIEITSIHEKKVPMNFVHRQSMSGAMRYSTPELVELAQKMDRAADRALKLELEVFEQLLNLLRNSTQTIIEAARALAQMDVFSALATLAEEQRFTRPDIAVDAGLEIIGGRHPVVEKQLRNKAQEFMANDCVLQSANNSSTYVWLITGPNMAGKSTFLRQNALIVILAQMGSYVPATSARIGIVDAVFSRVGASDDLSRGQSTFMVEMLETASILHQATSRSFVILDEIGRGTATYDGLAIAWAVVEHLHDVTRCRTLFATHYHELTSLAESRAGIACYHSRVQEHNDVIVFLHQIAAGQADRSYGVHVAKLAGLPAKVTARAAQLLAQFESTGSAGNTAQKQGSLALDDVPPITQVTYVSNARLHDALLAIDPDQLTPKQALDALYQLKVLI
jgi:DNA mismatch repair protein MutS